MAKKRKEASNDRPRPASTPEAREKQLISMAVDLAEKQLLEGTASNQVIIHYLKLGSRREKLEEQMMEKKAELLSAQADSVKSSKHTEELYEEALRAMRVYSGYKDDYEDDE